MFKKIFLKEVKDNVKLKDDFFGIILSGFILVTLLSLFVFMFIGLIKGFSVRKLDIELLILFTSFALILIVLLNFNSNMKILFLNKEKDLLETLPILKKDIVCARLSIVYLKEVFSVIVFVLPFLISYGIFKNMGMGYYFKTVLVVLTIPFISIFLQMLIFYPYLIYKKLFYKKFVLTILILTVVLLGLFVLYNYVLEFIIGLINNNRLQSLFSVENGVMLRNICKFMIPLKYAGAFLKGNNINLLYYLLFICLFAFLSIALGIVFSRNLIFFQEKYLGKKRENKKLSIKKTLYKKEIIEIYRNKEYMLGYVVVIFSLPVITYLTARVINVFITRMFGNSFVFVFLLIFVLLFSVLSNSFGATILNKEKNNMTMNVIPISLKTQINVKRNLVIMIALASILITSLVLFITNIFDLKEMAIVFLSSSLFTIASLLNALRKDIVKNKNSLNKNYFINILLGIIVGVFAVVIEIIISKEMMMIVLMLEMILIFMYAYYKYNDAFKKVVMI